MKNIFIIVYKNYLKLNCNGKIGNNEYKGLKTLMPLSSYKSLEFQHFINIQLCINIVR